MRLDDLVRQYILVRGLGSLSAYQVEHSIDLFGEPDVSALRDSTVSSWLRDLTDTHSQRTVAGHRANLLSVWRYAAARGLCDPPGEIRRCPRPRPRPVAWSQQQVRDLLRVAARLADKRTWALLAVAYWSGLRRSDLFRLTQADIADDGRIWLRQHKTGSAHVAQIPPEVVAAVRRLDGEHPLEPCDVRRWYREMAALCRLAGVPRGALQRMRRTGATLVAAREGLSRASLFLGHATPGMVAYYVDRSQLTEAPPQPPALDG